MTRTTSGETVPKSSAPVAKWLPDGRSEADQPSTETMHGGEAAAGAGCGRNPPAHRSWLVQPRPTDRIVPARIAGGGDHDCPLGWRARDLAVELQGDQPGFGALDVVVRIAVCAGPILLGPSRSIPSRLRTGNTCQAPVGVPRLHEVWSRISRPRVEPGASARPSRFLGVMVPVVRVVDIEETHLRCYAGGADGEDLGRVGCPLFTAARL